MPTIPHGCSSGDSLFSASSGRIGTPPEISSAASSADENEDEKSRFIEEKFLSLRKRFVYKSSTEFND